MARFYGQYITELYDRNKISDTDKLICSYIDSHKEGSFDQEISDEDDWSVFYHLSDLRTAILHWYDFHEEATVLEIGAGFGALTGVLCSKCAHVTAFESSFYRASAIIKRYHSIDNLDVYTGDVKQINIDRKFDYIVIAGELETIGKGTSDQNIYAEYLRELTGYLKPEGKMLIAAENRFGVRYFCGAAEPHTDRAFDGINKYPFGTTGYSFTRQELIDILNKAGLDHHKFYYPLPDYKLTQLVYTEEYLPEKNLKERLIPYYLRNDTLVSLESELYDDIIDNQVFPFFANSFFVECGFSNEFCNVIYAAVSIDRGEDRSYATKIYSDQLVRKQPLYLAGIESAKELCSNIDALKHCSIPVVEHRWNGKWIELPYIDQPSLSNYIKHIIGEDMHKFYEILDQIYHYILQSSEQVLGIENEMLQFISADKKEAAMQLDWGPILRHAYMELIPLNCFYSEGKMMFFDQEFVRTNYPAKYVLFRALYYIYSFTPNAERILPLEILKEKYGLIQTWDYFVEEETRFLNEIRQQDKLRQFYRRAKPDWGRIITNISSLDSEESKVAKIKIPESRKQVWRRQLELVDVIDKLCSKNGIRYFLVHGTLLGAVRHKGFIPWDDDIDIALPREDYDKLVNIAQSELSEHYFLQTPENDQDCFYGGYMKLRSNDTTGIELINWEHNCNHGIWIDIFPLDHCYNEPKHNKKKLQKVTHYQRLLFAKVYHEQDSFRDMKNIHWKWYRSLSGFYNKNKLYHKLDKALRAGNEQNSEMVGVFTHYTGGKKLLEFNREDFASSILLPFEHRKLPAPVGFQNCLKATFGEDYAAFPAQEYRVPHHKAFFAPEVPYNIYTRRFMETFKEAKNKTIVLFGAGMMFDDYMEKKGKEYPPSFIVDNNSAKWGTTKQGIPIRNPEDILMIDKDKIALIICNIYFRQIEAQLQRMGITDYYIYVQDKEWLTSDPSAKD